MSAYRFKDITLIPGAKELIDIVLSRTQRQTPTQIHPQFKISRIRSFYMRKVKFCQQTINDKLSVILKDFPKLDEIHPFYGDLCSVLYDRDHYKLALGHINTVRSIVDTVAKEYVRLLKYADSPYKCKMLKRAGLGRMCTAVKKLQASLTYLEEVRQHLGRLPSIIPTTRTLILTGYPNVGKSSFMNLVSRANVDVQEYAFTTKSLFVGHFDYDYTRWQVIDTPGILDRPLDERNTIEMTAITALAHIHATVLYFLDVSERCGFTLESQINLFHSIKPLFKNKPLLIVLNKVDLRSMDDLLPEEQASIKAMADGLDDVEFLPTSCITSEGVDAARNQACTQLLKRRVENKIESRKADSIMSRLHVTRVSNGEVRKPFIPESVLSVRQLTEDAMDCKETFETEKAREERFGGPGVYSVDLRKKFLLRDSSWRYDVVPEIMDGKNIADFVDPDPDLMKKIIDLEKETALLTADDGVLEEEMSSWRDTQRLVDDLHSKIRQKRFENSLKKSRNTPIMPRRGRQLSEVETGLKKSDYETEGVRQRSRSAFRTPLAVNKASFAKGNKRGTEEMEDVSVNPAKRLRSMTLAKRNRSASRVPSRVEQGLPREKDRNKAIHIARRNNKSRNIMGKKGESDRFIGDAKPKHLFCGKRGIGKTDRR